MRTVRHLLEAKAPEIFAVRPDAPVLDAVRQMAEKHVGALLVTEGSRLVGIISERDYARKVRLHGKWSHDVLVREIMTEDVVTVDPSRTVEECMAIVTKERVRHLPVCDGDRLVGVISIGDVVKDIIRDLEHNVDDLMGYIMKDGPGG